MKSSTPNGFPSPYLLCLLVMILAAAMWRLMPHPMNFGPVMAMALFSGASIPRRAWAYAAPLGAMLLSDIVLYSQTYSDYLFTASIPVYFSIALIVGLGFWLQGRRNVLNIAAGTLAGSVLFFLITNFSAWLWDPTYSKDLGGLMWSYIAGIPFFRNQLAGDICFSVVLFGGFALAQRYVTVLRPESETAAVKE